MKKVVGMALLILYVVAAAAPVSVQASNVFTVPITVREVKNVGPGAVHISAELQSKGQAVSEPGLNGTFPVPVGNPDLRLKLWITLLVNDLKYKKQGNPDAKLTWSFGGERNEVLWSPERGFYIDLDLGKYRSGSYNLLIEGKFRAGRTYTQIPFLVVITLSARNGSGTSGAVLHFPFIEYTGSCQPLDIYQWQLERAGIRGTGQAGQRASGIDPLFDLDMDELYARQRADDGRRAQRAQEYLDRAREPHHTADPRESSSTKAPVVDTGALADALSGDDEEEVEETPAERRPFDCEYRKRNVKITSRCDSDLKVFVFHGSEYQKSWKQAVVRPRGVLFIERTPHIEVTVKYGEKKVIFDSAGKEREK